MSVELRAEGLWKSYGGATACQDVSIKLSGGSIVGLVGPNGAGKTTALNCLAGAVRPDRGQVVFNGRDITSALPHTRADLGIQRTFQHYRLFPALTVSENVGIARADESVSYGLTASVLRTPRYRRAEREMRLAVEDALGRVGLGHAIDADITELVPAELRLVEIATVMVSGASCLLFDEPTSGISDVGAAAVFTLLQELRDEGKAIIVVEHRVRSVAEMVDDMVVMDQGQVVASGPPEEVRKTDTVARAYMGGE